MPSSGDTLNHYTILEPLGKGGMGEVFLAHDTRLERNVALKFLHEAVRHDTVYRKRLLREAKAAASLDHPFICKIYETGETGDGVFIAMEYVAGQNLRQRLKAAPLSFKESVKIGLEIADALQEAHNKGIVHRDLKPDNILLTPQGHVKVMDFGLAKVTAADAPTTLHSQMQTGSGTQALTEEGSIMGTLAYMSPEQARGQEVDSRSDIFSFGVVLYEMLSGENPFIRPTGIETLSAILRDPPPDLEKRASSQHALLGPILNKAMAKDSALRYQTIRELADDFGRVAEAKPTGRRPAVLWAGLGAVLVVALLVAGTLKLARNDAPAPPVAAQKPVSVLIADFENQTGDSVFEGTLEPTFTIALEGASFISSYDRGQARRIGLQVKPDAAGLDPALARLVAIRQGISAVLSGSILRHGQGYRVSVKVMDAVSGRVIATEETDAPGKEQVLATVGALSNRVRKALGDAGSNLGAEAVDETFTAASLDAAHNYAEAQRFQMEGKPEDAIRHYTRAIQLDPDFGRAYSGLASVYANLGRRAEAEEHYKQAMARIDRMTDREKYRTRGGYYLMIRNHAKAIEEFSALIKLYPADTTGIYNLGLAHFYGRDMARAVEQGRRAVEHYPKNAFYRTNLALFAMYAGDFDLAIREARTALEINPSYVAAHVALALSQLAKGQPQEAAGTYRRLQAVSQRGASLAAIGLADLALYEGRLSDAEALLQKAVKEDLSNQRSLDAATKLMALAEVDLTRHQAPQAAALAGRAIATSRQDAVALAAGRVYVEAGRDAAALPLASELSHRLEPDPQSYAKLIEGEKLLRQGAAREAVRVFLEAQKLADTWLGRFDLGRAYLQAGAFTEAYSEFDLCLKRRGEATAVFLDDIPSYRYLPPVYYYLGRAQEGLKSPAAAESFRTFLAIKEKGDGSDPLVVDARRRISGQ